MMVYSTVLTARMKRNLVRADMELTRSWYDTAFTVIKSYIFVRSFTEFRSKFYTILHNIMYCTDRR